MRSSCDVKSGCSNRFSIQMSQRYNFRTAQFRKGQSTSRLYAFSNSVQVELKALPWWTSDLALSRERSCSCINSNGRK